MRVTRSAMAFRFESRLGSSDIRVPLGEGVHCVGSAVDCSIRLNDPTVSRRHAEIEVSDGRLRVRDLGSRNGSRIDGRPLRDAIDLTPGQQLQFGLVDAQVVALSDQDAEAAVPGDATLERLSGTSANELPLTLATREYGRFCLHGLPLLIDALVRRTPAPRFAEMLLDALCRNAEQVYFEIHHGDAAGAAPVAAGGSPQAGPVESRMYRDGAWRIDARFPAQVSVATMDAIGQLAIQLLGLATRKPALPNESRLTAAGPTDMPEPPAPASRNARMQRIYRESAMVAGGGISVLIEGESGTGKELLARYLHACSGSSRPWVALNCASLPRDLLEAELFGIERGVATGVDARAGKFELAHGGTLFLDEVGDMALDTQARILRVLQEREVFRIGGQQARPAEVRVVAATNRPLETMVANGEFRRDLYHRIADWSVTLPALRERSEDIASLAGHFLAEACQRRGIGFGGISVAALDVLMDYDWPGNARELEREMQRVALFLNDGELLASDHLQERLRRRPVGPSMPTGSMETQLLDTERRAILDALEASAGSVGSAARALGMGRSTLYRRIAELGIETP